MIRRLTWMALAVSMAAAPAMAGAQRQRQDRGPEEGAEAPDFTLSRLDDEGNADPENTVALSELQGRPVALIFGSYT